MKVPVCGSTWKWGRRMVALQMVWWLWIFTLVHAQQPAATSDHPYPGGSGDSSSDPILVEPLVPSNPSSSKMMTWSQFQTILRTELGTEFGGGHRNPQPRQLLRRSNNETIRNDNAEQLWNATLQYEWNKLLSKNSQAARILNDENSSNSNNTYDNDDQDGSIAPLASDNYEEDQFNTTTFTSSDNENETDTSPFVVCDMQYARSGEDAASIIRDLLGEYLIPVYNKIDMTCFTVQTRASNVLALPAGIVAAPLTAEMKMGEDLINHIATSEPMVSRIEVVFCTASSSFGNGGGIREDTTANAWQIYQSLLRPQDRHRRRQEFLESRSTRDPQRKEFWHRKLTKDVDDELCADMLEKMELDFDNDTMTLTLDSEHFNNNTYRDCLQAAVVDLAVQPESCFIWAYQDTQLLNTVASGVIQSGRSSSKPFYDVGLEGSGQIVALSDSGLDTDNCYFWDSGDSVSKNQDGGFDLNVRKVVQYFAASDATDVYKGHGTHVAGTIAGRRATSGQQESDGEADGIARKAKLAFYDIGSLSGRLIAPLASNLFAPGYRAGARIHSSSWGIPGQNFYSGYDRAMDAYMYKNPDFLYVVAAGNAGFGDKRNTVATPAICKNGISVGASGNASPHTRPEQGGPNYVSEFSSRGPTRDGRRKPDVVAPGDSILSALAEPTVKGECGTSFKSGTSMATPVVSGAAALIRQYFREGWHVTGSRNTSVGFTPRASLVKAVLINGGQPLVAVQKKTGEITQSTSPYDVNQGFGRINLLESVPLQGKNSLKGLFVNGKSISNGSKHSYPITINDSSCGILSATLVWTDPEGAPNCNSGCMLNDLDLYVTKSGGSRYYPNGLDSADTINNAERVQIRNPSGTYTIYVEASDLIQAQEYSLSVTGCFTTGGNGSGGSGSGGSIGGGGDNDNENTTGGGGNSSETNCPDGSGRISIGNGKTRTCSWLKSNLSAYGNLCSFRDVAAECPSTCRACKLFSSSGSTKTASTRWDGKKRWYGNMFDIQAKKDLTIRSFDFHTNQSDSYRIKVFVKGGILSSRQSWREVCDATVTGSGVYGAPTRIPASACEPVSVSSGNWVTVYVTMTNASFLIMTGDVSTGTSLVNTADMRLRSGVGVTYGGSSVSIFKYKTFEDNAWNGNVHYTLDSSSVQEDGAAEEEGNDDADECLDQFGTVWMDDTVGNRTCAWLTEHRDRYGFVCAFADVSVFCPATCDYCT